MSHAPTLVTRGTRALGKVLFLDCPLKWNVPEEIPKACVQFLLPSLSLSPGHIPIPATPLCGGYFNHRWGDPKEEIWRWELHHLETWSRGGFSKLLQPRGSTSFGCSRCSLTAGGCQDLVVVGRCIGELAYQVHGAGLISWHILPSSLSPKTVHPRDPSLPRLQGYGSVPGH